MVTQQSVTSAVRRAQQGRRGAFDNPNYADGHRRIANSMNVIAKRYGQRQKRVRALSKPKVRTALYGTIGAAGSGVPTTDTA